MSTSGATARARANVEQLDAIPASNDIPMQEGFK